MENDAGDTASLFIQVIVSSPGSPSSEESEASPEPINKSLLGGLGLEKNNEGATANSTGPGTEQITPTSSVDTEEGNTPHPEEGEKGVEGDAEASDDDRHQHVPNTHQSLVKYEDLIGDVRPGQLRRLRFTDSLENLAFLFFF